MGTKREIWAADWKAAREPILYSFTALKCVDVDCTELTRVALGSADKSRSVFDFIAHLTLGLRHIQYQGEMLLPFLFPPISVSPNTR